MDARARSVRRDVGIFNKVPNFKKSLSPSRIAFNLLAVSLLVMLVRKGWRDLDVTWDSLMYHLPFAALRAGIMPAGDYKLASFLGDIYRGFPVIPDYLEGWAWRLTSRVQAANLIGLTGLLIFCGFVTRRFRLAFCELIICVLAIPVILIACSSAYIDLWVNSMMAIMVALLFQAFIQPETFSLGDVFLALAACSVAINSKPQFVAPGSLALLAFAAILVFNRNQLTALNARWNKLSSGLRIAAIFSACVLIGSGYVNSAKNWLLFHNPIYPVAFSMGPISWAGVLGNVSHDPAYLRHTIEPVKWLLSIFEYDAFDGRHPMWAIDAGYLPATSHALRMGGYFGAYVALNLVWFAFLQQSRFRSYGRRPLYFFVGLSIITACLPISHELRYYSFWMLILVMLNLILIRATEESERKAFGFLFVGGALACLSFVVLSNGAVYLRADGLRPKDLVANMGVKKALADMHLKDGETVCVAGKTPFSLMYAPIFNQDVERATHYHVIVAETESGCEGARVVK